MSDPLSGMKTIAPIKASFAMSTVLTLQYTTLIPPVPYQYPPRVAPRDATFHSPPSLSPPDTLSPHTYPTHTPQRLERSPLHTGCCVLGLG